MAVGDEIGLTEPLYQELIGRYVATIEVLTKRLVAKDQRIAVLETQEVNLVGKITELERMRGAQVPEPKEGDVYYGDNPPEAPAPKRKK